MDQRHWHIAILQMDIALGAPDKNYAKVSELLDKAMEATPAPDVIILPELWNTGYALEQLHELADEDGARAKKLLSEFCREHQVCIMGGSIAERRGQEIYNTMYAFDRDGQLVGHYSKIHLFRLMDEEKYLAAGEWVGQFELQHIPAGMMICYDIRFPELARKLALAEAKLVFVPAEWPHPRLHHWRTLLTARAIENQLYVIACNRVGKSGTTDFFGHSMIIDPWGEIIVEGDEQENILHATIDIELVDEVRARIPIFEDRRPQLY